MAPFLFSVATKAQYQFAQKEKQTKHNLVFCNHFKFIKKRTFNSKQKNVLRKISFAKDLKNIKHYIFPLESGSDSGTHCKVY